MLLSQLSVQSDLKILIAVVQTLPVGIAVTT